MQFMYRDESKCLEIRIISLVVLSQVYERFLNLIRFTPTFFHRVLSDLITVYVATCGLSKALLKS